MIQEISETRSILKSIDSNSTFQFRRVPTGEDFIPSALGSELLNVVNL